MAAKMINRNLIYCMQRCDDGYIWEISSFTSSPTRETRASQIWRRERSIT